MRLVVFGRSLEISLILCFAIPCVGDETRISRFREEYPKAAEALLERDASVRGKAQLWHGEPGKPKPQHPAEVDFVLDHDREKVVIRSFTKEGTIKCQYIYIVDPREKALFDLVKQPGDSEYSLQGRSYGPVEYSMYVDIVGRFLKSSTHILGRSIVEMINSPEIELLDVRPIASAAGELTELHLLVGTKDPKLDMVLTFEPSAGWLLRSGGYGIVPADPNRTSFEVNYDKAFDEGKRPHTVVFRTAQREDRCEFTQWQASEATPEEFDPSQYGLPKLHEPASRSSMAYWILALAVGFLAVVWALLRTLKARTETKNAA